MDTSYSFTPYFRSVHLYDILSQLNYYHNKSLAFSFDTDVSRHRLTISNPPGMRFCFPRRFATPFYLLMCILAHFLSNCKYIFCILSLISCNLRFFICVSSYINAPPESIPLRLPAREKRYLHTSSHIPPPAPTPHRPQHRFRREECSTPCFR